MVSTNAAHNKLEMQVKKDPKTSCLYIPKSRVTR